MFKHLTKEEINTLKTRYESGESSGKIARSLGVSDGAILAWLRKLKVPRRDNHLARRIYPVWDDAFKKINNESAYWAGFLMADGCVIDESRLQIGLSVLDKYHLIKLRKFLQTETRPIPYVPSNNSCYLQIHSTQIIKDLTKYGIIKNKTYNATAMNNIDQYYSFWLGVMDGDGTIGFTSERNLRLRMYGTSTLMKQFALFLKINKIRGKSNKFDVSIGNQDLLRVVSLTGERAYNFLSKAYCDSPVFLDRKKEKFNLIIDKTKNKWKWYNEKTAQNPTNYKS